MKIVGKVCVELFYAVGVCSEAYENEIPCA